MGTATLDRFLSAVGEVILSSSQLRTAAEQQHALDSNAALASGFDRVDRTVGELQRRALELRTTPLQRIVETLPRTARQVAERAGKRVEVELRGAELELDRSILDRLNDPLVHVVRNAVDHGLETPEARRAAGKPEVGRLVVEARREKDSITIEVRDDGRGIDLGRVREKAVAAGFIQAFLAEDLPPEEIAAFIFRPGLTTAERISEVSGRGVGMDAVRSTVEALGGRVEVRTEAGQGTAIALVVPVTAAIQRTLLVGLAEETVALPIGKVERILEVEPEEIEASGSEAFALIDDEPVLVLDLARLLALPGRAARPVPLVLAELRGQRVALRVDAFVGQQEIYVKPLPELLANVRMLVGLTVLGDGRPVFLLDPNHLA